MDRIELAEKVTCAKLERKLAKLEMETAAYRFLGTLCAQGTEIIPLVIASAEATNRRAVETHNAYMKEREACEVRAQELHARELQASDVRDARETELHEAKLQAICSKVNKL
jgi:hypothetical protein